MDDYNEIQDSSNLTDTYASNSYSHNDSRTGGYENDRSNDFSFSKENDSSPTRYQVHVEVDTYRSSNNDDFTNRSNAHENDRSNDFSVSKENDNSSITNQGHAGGDEHHSSNNDDLISDIKQSSNSDSEDLPSKNGLENHTSEGLENAEDSDLKNINFKVDEYSQNTNQDSRNDRFMHLNDSTDDDNNCCSCKGNPLMCLAFFCDCFGL